MRTWYYLNFKGQLIHKRTEPSANNPLVKHRWVCESDDRSTAWKIVLEGLALGADSDRVKGLARKWNMDYQDVLHFMKYTTDSGIAPSNELSVGLEKFVQEIMNMDINKFWNKVKVDIASVD